MPDINKLVREQQVRDVIAETLRRVNPQMAGVRAISVVVTTALSDAGLIRG